MRQSDIGRPLGGASGICHLSVLLFFGQKRLGTFIDDSKGNFATAAGRLLSSGLLRTSYGDTLGALVAFLLATFFFGQALAASLHPAESTKMNSTNAPKPL